jgi:hypothetical protein
MDPSGRIDIGNAWGAVKKGERKRATEKESDGCQQSCLPAAVAHTCTPADTYKQKHTGFGNSVQDLKEIGKDGEIQNIISLQTIDSEEHCSRKYLLRPTSTEVLRHVCVCVRVCACVLLYAQCLKGVGGLLA